MAFCTNCGNQVSDDARFCPSCGQAVTAAAAAGAGPVPPQGTPGYGSGYPNTGFQGGGVPFPLEYSIQGDNLQVARVRLKPGQEIYAEAGKMLYKTPQVQWETRMSGNSLGQKIWGAVKRKLMGESLFMTYFRTNMEGEVGFAGSYPGRIQVFELAPGQSVLVQ
ncbi:MAG TPA: AIM24 family protein, partial [Bryobacteraceae bacterium]|nr:AIM24 family protein [Bryobacteraceae bacterium]